MPTKYINNKKVYFLLFFSLVTAISFLFIIIFGVIKFNELSRNNHNVISKSQIRNRLLKNGSKTIINNILINKLPDGKMSIYVGGTSISDSNGLSGALVFSTDKGLSWKTDKYFDSTGKYSPIIYKIATEFYTDKNGTSDSIAVTGKYLPSIASDLNKSSNQAGQIAYKRLYYAKTNTKTNVENKSDWNDIAERDAVIDGNTNKVTNRKIITASTVKYTSVLSENKKVVEQNHIYFVANDETVNINSIHDIPYLKRIQKYKFYIYDLVLINNIISPSFSLKVQTNLALGINPVEIYGVSTDGQRITSTSYFDAENTSFLFKSGIISNHDSSDLFNNRCIIVERQAFVAYVDSDGKLAVTPYNNSIVIECDQNVSTKYIYWIQPGTTSYFDNFFINTISVNPSYFDGSESNSIKNALVFGGQKNNISYMSCPTIKLVTLYGTTPLLPKFSSHITSNKEDGSYISKIIPFFVGSYKNNSNAEDISFLIFGNKMNTSNKDLVINKTDYVLKPNIQNLKNQGLLLVNINFMSISLTSGIKKNTIVSFSQLKYFENSSIVNFIDNSDNYYEIGSFTSNDSRNQYTFSGTGNNVIPSTTDIGSIIVYKTDNSTSFQKPTKPNNFKYGGLIGILAALIGILVALIVFFFILSSVILISKRKKITKNSKIKRNKIVKVKKTNYKIFKSFIYKDIVAKLIRKKKK